MAERLTVIRDGTPPDDAWALGIADYDERAFNAGYLAGSRSAILRTITADKFCAVEIGPSDYLVRPVIVRGTFLTIPKVGKTTFVAHAV